MSRPSMTPRSIAPAPTSGARVPSTSTPPAAPIGPPPSAPTTGWSWAPCSPNPRSPHGSCRSPAGSTSESRSCQSGPTASWNSGPNANWPSSCSASRPASSRASTWPFSTAATPWRAWSGRWSCPQAARPGLISSLACGATLGCTPCPCPRSSAPRGSRDRSPSGVSD